MLQTVAAGHNRRGELLHPCVPGLLQSLHFLGGRLGPALRGFAIDEQELRHDTLLRTVSPAPAEARPPPYAITTNMRRHFGHRSQLFCKCVSRLGGQVSHDRRSKALALTAAASRLSELHRLTSRRAG